MQGAAYTRTELTLLKLGLSRRDLLTIDYSEAAWYVAAAATEDGRPDEGPRKATQADIDAF